MPNPNPPKLLIDFFQIVLKTQAIYWRIWGIVGSYAFSAGSMSGGVWRFGDWGCTCGTHNFASRTTCRDCNADKQAQVASGTLTTDWACAKCSVTNFPSRATCRDCGAPSGSPAKRVTMHKGDWVCTGCNDLNFSYRDVCRGCNAPSPNKNNDWACTGCGDKNFGWRTECRECKVPKP